MAAPIFIKATQDLTLKAIIKGELFVIKPNGEIIPLEVGDVVQIGEVIQYSPGAVFEFNSNSNNKSYTQADIQNSDAVIPFDADFQNTTKDRDSRDTDNLLSNNEGSSQPVYIHRTGQEATATNNFDTQSINASNKNTPDNVGLDSNSDTDNDLTNTYHSGISPSITVTIDDLGDNILNNDEYHSTQTLTGTVSGDYLNNSTITVLASINGADTKIGTTTPSADNTWSIDISSDTLKSIDIVNDDIVFTVKLDSATSEGFSSTATNQLTVEVDTVIPEADVYITSIAGDDWINHAESETSVTITGYATSDTDNIAGDVVSLYTDIN
ncbi:hypothetical protein, partial [uncultured Shewanella sp.]|uniref:hypothetical protein n=1 Tax=uncultured Shewanella sp. TaxID=173975 RepID=UPI002634E615